MQRKRALTRTALLKAARELIAERGLDGLRISDVAERGDVGLGSFYSHFPSREALVDEILRETLTTLADNVLTESASMDSAEEAVSTGIRRIVRLCQSDPDLARLLIQLERGERRFEELIWVQAFTLLVQGIENNRFQVADPELALQMALAGTFRVMRSLIDQPYAKAAERDCAYTILRSFGLDDESAQALANRPL